MRRTVIGLLVAATMAIGNVGAAEGTFQLEARTDAVPPGTSDVTPPAALTGPLTWSPPNGWESFEPAYLSASGGYLELDPQQDYRIVAPDVVEGLVSIRGGRNVVWIGGHINISKAGAADVATQRRGLVVSDSPNGGNVEGRVVHLEGLLIDGNDLAEGINTNAPSAVIQIQNVHVAGVRIRGADDRDGTGIYERGNHSDVVQIWGSQHELRIDGLTGASNYQGFFFEETAANRKRNPVRLRRINLTAISAVGEDGYTYAGHRMYRWLPEDVGQQFIDSGTVWMKHHAEGGWVDGYSYKVAYRNASGVLVPDPPPGTAQFDDTVAPMFPQIGQDGTGTYAWWPESNTVTVNNLPGVVSWDGRSPGRIYSGTPPGGDYVPAASVGIGYVSPGYRVNQAPVAVDDTVRASRGTSTATVVLDNDFDPDGDAITPTIVSQPQHGTVDVLGDGTIRYTHNGAATQSDSFTYKVNDGELSSSAASVTVGFGFIDDDGHIHEQSIEAIADAGITLGCNPPTNDRYCPSDRVTRGQMAAFLVRALNLTNDGGGNHFVDDNGTIFEGAIDKLATAGITLGCNPPTNNRYCPDSFVTRAEMAAFLVRAFGYSDSGSGDLFTDDDGLVFEGSIDKLATAGVTKGCNPPANTRYCPQAHVTRADMAAFLDRALGLSS